MPVLENGGSSLTWLEGRGGYLGVVNVFPWNFLHVTHVVTTRLTASRPLRIQYFSLTQLRVSFIPSWWTTSCFSRMTNSVKRHFDGRSIGCLADSDKVDWLILPSQRTMLSVSMNSPSYLTIGFVPPIASCRISAWNAEAWMHLIHIFSASINSSASNSCVLGLGSFFFTFLVNRRTMAVTRSNLSFGAVSLRVDKLLKINGALGTWGQTG